MRLVLKALMLIQVFFWDATATAQTYPARPVRVIVPYPPGGGADYVVRVFAKALSEQLGQQFIVDNRPGANGNIGSEVAARSPANGYTLLGAANGNLTVNPHLYRSMPIDMLRDLAPITVLAEQPNILIVHPSMPVKTVRELVAVARARPGTLDFASGGIGSSSHIVAELFRIVAKIDITHVPYKGNAAAMSDLIGGQIPMMFNNMAPSVVQMKAGKVRALAVTGARRSPVAPDVPTMAQAGYPGVLFTFWVGLLAPAGTPADVIAKINAEAGKAARSREVRERLAGEGAEPLTTSPSEMGETMRAETTKWAKVIQAANIKRE